MAPIGTMLTLRLSPAPRPLASAVFLAPAPTLAATPDKRRERRERRERVDNSSDNGGGKVRQRDNLPRTAQAHTWHRGLHQAKDEMCSQLSEIFVEGIGEIRTGVETNMHHDMLWSWC